MTQKQDTYKQTEFGRFGNDDLLTFLENDPTGKDWLDAVSKNIQHQIDLKYGEKAKQFGQEGIKQLIVAAILRGGYVPMFAR